MNAAWTARTILAVSLLCFSGRIAIAEDSGQDPKRGQTVEDLPRSEWEARGMRMGAFLAYPKIGFSETFTDNVYATKDDTSSDLITAVTAAIAIESNFSRHQLNFKADAEVASYVENSDENYQDFGASIDGRVDVIRDLNGTARLGFDKGHEQRSSPDDTGALEPAGFSILSANVGVSYKPNRLSIKWDAGTDFSNYNDVETAAGSIVNHDDRDRGDSETSLRLGYQVHPGYEGFLRGTYGFVDYTDSVDDAGVDRDSDKYAFDVGVTLDLTGIIEGDIFVGYMSQSYDDATFRTSSGVSAGAEITWIITALTTLNGSLERKFNETTATDSSGYISTDMDFEVEHELLRNLILKGTLGYGNDSYNGISKEDDRISGGLEASYLLNRSVHATLSYSHQTRDSTEDTSDFSENKLALRFSLQI